MENQDKTYMWLMIIAFVALVVATGFCAAELVELKAENTSQPKNAFE